MFLSLEDNRNSLTDRQRVADLMALLPTDVQTALDIGARDGFLARHLADRYAQVTALDLAQPELDDPRVRCVQGDAAALQFHNGAFDLLLCAEVLEHIPPPQLPRVCAELARVAARYIVVGVPYRQDIRHGRSTCQRCGGRNPPWGHVNRFDEARLRSLFPAYGVQRQTLVGVAEPGTNAVSAWLMDLAGNPYGTYIQDEPCIHCGAALQPPPARTLPQKVYTRLAVQLQKAQAACTPRHANWMHALLAKKPVKI
ncbi:class I SAM-dependent methyltransferase [Rhodoferax sp. WC2427]|uniref:class I SAM-dependent methyltransferase n=1 Tax=Rhodoferax sp. WC2427 TaxID=3234144 RepID=UPI003465C512